MPATSEKQRRFMQAVSHNPAFAKKAGVPQSVGKEFSMKNPKKFAKGGQTVDEQIKRGEDIVNRIISEQRAKNPPQPRTPSPPLRSNISPEEAGNIHRMLEERKRKEFEEFTVPVNKAKGGPVKESKAMVGKEVSFMKKKGAPKSMVQHEMMEAGMKPSRAKKFAKGGGVESKGKTRGKFV